MCFGVGASKPQPAGRGSVGWTFTFFNRFYLNNALNEAAQNRFRWSQSYKPLQGGLFYNIVPPTAKGFIGKIAAASLPPLDIERTSV